MFAHFVWNAAIIAADFIVCGRFQVKGQSVLELGAGAGLPGIVATLEGAEMVVLSDYESPTILANLQRNVLENIPKQLQGKVKVEGHIWGEDTFALTQYV